jgi:hypothetical protein
MLHTIRIPEEHWGKVWFALLSAGPVSRVSQDFIYIIDDVQLRLLRRKKLPFELLASPNGSDRDKKNA